MERHELLVFLQHLRAIQEDTAEISNIATTHEQADLALLDYLDDPEITKAFEVLRRWYQ